MYVLARSIGQSIEMADGLIEVKVLSITGRIVRLGIVAPREIGVVRSEIKGKEGKQNHDSTGDTGV